MPLVGLVSLESTMIARLVVSVAIVARILLEAYKVAKWILGGLGVGLLNKLRFACFTPCGTRLAMTEQGAVSLESTFYFRRIFHTKRDCLLHGF